MRLLRRAPREVYRVYGEDEFWARSERELCAGADRVAPTDQVAPTDVAAPAAARRTLRRVVVSTVLLASAGAVGSLAMIGSGPARHGRQRAVAGPSPERGGLLAASRSFAASRSEAPRAGGARIWSERVSLPAPVPARSAHAVAASDPGAPIEVAAVDVRSHAIPTEAPSPTADAPSESASPQSSSPGQSEFGFER